MSAAVLAELSASLGRDLATPWLQAPCAAVPQQTVPYIVEYDSPPLDPSRWWLVHRAMPCVFRSGMQLFTDNQRVTIDQLFPDGWKSDAGHPLLSCIGVLREDLVPDDSFEPVEHSQRWITVGTALNRELNTAPDGANMILTNASMHSTIVTAAMCVFLLSGPPLFADFNLLASTETQLLLRPVQDHVQLKLSIGSADSIDTRDHFYGVDAYSYLVEGEKQWVMAPAQHRAGFDELVVEHNLLSSGVMHAETAAAFRRYGILAVHQKPGDVVFIPGGWVYAVRNLEATVSFGASYLRAWNLGITLDYAAAKGREATMSLLNIDGLFDRLREGFWGVPPKEAELLLNRWAQLQREWEQAE